MGGTVASVDNAAAASHAGQLPLLLLLLLLLLEQFATVYPIFYTYHIP